MSSGSRVRICRRPAGSTDPWQILRTTGDSLTVATDTTRSEEIRDDRTRGDQKTIMINPNGTVNFEFSAANFDSILSSVLAGSWAVDTPVAGTDQLVNGTAETRWDYLKSYMDLDEHILISDAVESQLQLSGNSGEKVTGQVTLMGHGHDDQYDPSADTFTEPQDTVIMDMSNNLHTVRVDGAEPASGVCLKGFDITISGNFQSDQCSGSQYQVHTPGSFDITGSVNFRFSSQTLEYWRKAVNSTPIALDWTLSEGGTSYVPTLPRIFLSGDLPGGSLDSILDLSLDITAARDTNAVMMSVDRTVA
ncbi:phage tail tube protein [Halomonas caseinilytica]|uniref:phage tail tube protein n=1 Tax=Halomonas caseinilytica TaxID=438744 RepID=UPI0007E56766|nr:phage tail tube protein [Halomonas caseinilytica]SEN64792.1 hypothetical protein SAMN04487952_1236 [Halomonas caseinilytica]